MKHKRFEENILVDEAYTNYGKVDRNEDAKKGSGIAKHFAETLEYGDKKKWYQQLPEEPSSAITSLSSEKVEELRKEANSALHGDTMAYETKTSKNSSSDHQWAKTLLTKGTIADRVAAATILIQLSLMDKFETDTILDNKIGHNSYTVSVKTYVPIVKQYFNYNEDNPIYNLTALRNLINSVKPAKKKDGIVIIDALSELLISELLIPDVKLRTFEQHPLDKLDEMTSGNKQARRNILKLWYYEDQLKELYGTYVEALNKFAHDSVDANKEKSVSAMSYLLMHHPEREKMLLSNIINKLGDPSQAVASKVIYHLCQLLYNHPNMKAVVLTEIEKMLFRSNISPRAQYYGICFLNQFFLGKDDNRIAENLIRIYFAFFKASIKKGEIDSRLMSAILTGVKRAYPFADKDRLAETSSHIDAIHRLVHLASLNVAIHALALLYHISDASKGTSDRYYSALYRKLTNADIFNTTHSALLFSLIYKSLKQDSNVDRVTAFIKRLLQLCCYMSPAQACGMLYLISQVLKNSDKKDALKLVWSKKELKEEVKEDPESQKETVEVGENSETNDTEDNVENGEQKVEDTEETKEEVKLESKKMDLLHGDKRDLLIDDDEEEAYVDLKIDDEGNVKPKKRRATAVTGWYHAKVAPDKTEDVEEKEATVKIQLKKTINMDRVITEYNPHARNPAFSGAHCTAYLELLPLANHFHPSVKLFAEKLIHDQIIQYSGDPLKDFAGIRFLDRFVFKNPKKRSENQVEGELKRVKGSHPKFAIRKNYVARGIKSVSVNSSTYLNEDAKRIPVDEKFLYDFLQKRRHVNDSDDEDSDNDSVTSEDFEQYLDSFTGTKAAQESDEELDYLAELAASKQKRPSKGDQQSDDELGGGGDDEDDDDIAGLDGEGGSDGELDISGDDDEPVLSGDEDELLLEDSDDEEQIDVPGKKSAKKKNDFKLKGSDDLGSLFASAEQFSTLLEETASNKKQGSSQAVSNADNASTKQLAWEENRDRWIKGYNKKILGHKGNNKKFKKKNFKDNPNKMADWKKGGKRKGGDVGGIGGKKRKHK